MEISDIKKIRKQIGITQKELAKMSNVSQSLIAKIESGILDPSYKNAMKIMRTLKGILNKNQMKAKDVMNKKIIMVEKKDRIKKAIMLMKKHEISQMPVSYNGHIVGLISESILLESILNDNGERIIKDVMKSPPPIIDEDSDINMVRELLKYWPIIVVSSNKGYSGIITKADVLRKALL